MSAYEKILEHIEGLEIVDTHEHLPGRDADRPKDTDVLAEWLTHYFSCDLVSAGLSDADLARARDSRGDLMERWKLVAPFWHAARSTGYGRSLDLAARDIYGVPGVSAETILDLDKQFRLARSKGHHYRRVLKKKSKIAVSIVDSNPGADPDFFAWVMRFDEFLCPTHRREIVAKERALGMKIHSVRDWKKAMEQQLNSVLERGAVGLKTGLAYMRSLRYEKVTEADAERAFNELFADDHSPEWRAPIKVGQPLQDHIMHHLLALCDERGLAFQFHTGIQEGNGNIIYHSNPVLLTNLFLEYGNVKFDIFHMGYPYMLELSNLAKNFRNVHIDMCWGHIVSPEAARRALVEWLDAVPANKISAFGGDYCFVDGVYGHQYLARRNVAAALAAKVLTDAFDLERAKEIATWLFIDNPKRIFGLKV